MLYVVATPIGEDEDIGFRAVRLLRDAELVIGEEFKETMRLLKRLNIENKIVETLNEHSQDKDLVRLLRMVREKVSVLVSDCGTPGFCDPGTDLVAHCHKNRITVRSVPGPSSLSAFLSVCGVKLNSFNFIGFLPANREKRILAMRMLKNEKRPFILMDTPYRLFKLLQELGELFPDREMTVGLELSTPNERILKGMGSKMNSIVGEGKFNFMLLVH